MIIGNPEFQSTLPADQDEAFGNPGHSQLHRTWPGDLPKVGGKQGREESLREGNQEIQ